VEIPLQINRIYSVTASHSGYLNANENVRTGGRENIKRTAKDEGDKMVLMHEIHLVPIEEEQRRIYAFTVEFDFNLFNIRPEEERKLDSAALLLEKFPYSTVVVSGHTDSVGTNTYNIKLGYNRAKEVSDYVRTWLSRKKVHLLNDLEIRTYGEVEPVAPNSTDEGRQRNRRVEIAIVRNK
jgi:outer membrane protein OmpA-like peptidoglycan-associated protein